MRKYWFTSLVAVLAIMLCAGPSLAAKRAKFGIDERHEEAKRVKFKPSTKKIRWKMTMPWSKGLLFYDMAVHFCDSVRLASAGRLDIKPFSAGEIVPAMQTFDAVSKGSVQAGHDWPGYWKGKDEAFVALGDVPFGLDSEGYNIWLYEQGGLELAQELYGNYNLVPLPAGQSGQDMGIFSNKKATRMEDFKGMKVRTVGWYMDILNRLGASATPMPGGEVYLALERGVIDGAEFSAPAMSYPMGFDEITKYSIQPGVHQPGSQCFVFFNKDAWDALPRDLQEIVKLAAKETQLWAYNWMQNLNAEAMNKLAEKVEIVQMDTATLIEFRKVAKKYVDEIKAKHPNAKKILESQESFIKDFETWRKGRSNVTPWSYETYISGTVN
ncbi:TRAP transporter substrate-binding protein [Desulfogranum mediterraneum]|uniref:TRAP transporter substrate-binding protein n=1 Tax=Desulfogranum mediterraneum TaxID=160661 RepID=UPI0004039977|nr:TRAP transporter substrate-binding protein DctP [Desulfogranum mediterraneum]